MSKSKIEWTDETWNPVTGCTKVSQGCKHCYAERVWPRLKGNANHVCFGRDFTDVQCHPERLQQPLHWKRPRMVFVNSMSDLFHEDVPFYFIDQVFAVMALSPDHTFQILTKRPERMKEYFTSPSRVRSFCKAVGMVSSVFIGNSRKSWTKKYDTMRSRGANKITAWLTEGGCAHRHFKKTQPNAEYPDWINWPLPNVWLGVSVEDQQTADERIPLLLQTPAAVRWISAEPLLGLVDLIGKDEQGSCLHVYEGRPKIDWVVAGGESGPKARPMHKRWVEYIQEQCQFAEVPFFFKQWGEWKAMGVTSYRNLPKGVKHCEWWDQQGKWYYGSPNGLNFAMARTGKKVAGCLLNGVEYKEMPVEVSE